MSGYPLPAAEVIGWWELQVDGYLGGRSNTQWLVAVRGSPLVLRRYPVEPLGEVAYELSVLRRLDALGWPVPVPFDDPVDVAGHTWCLFSRLPGAPPTASDPGADPQARGCLLAQLHDHMETLTDLGQRYGSRRAEDVVADPELHRQLDTYERLFPRVARVLRWHAERARACFDALDLEHRQLIVLHGDFVARNLLYRDGKLTGIVDFEGTHLNHRASEFALAWQGKYDEVIRGYEQVRPLDELDRALLAPCLWSWVLLGVADEIRRMTSGTIQPHGFDWQFGRLLRRSPLMGREATPYRDR